MIGELKSVQLTQFQIVITEVALQAYMKHLLSIPSDEIEGGEHEDYLLAESVLKSLAMAANRKA